MQYIRIFAGRHDQLPAFHATYLVLTALIAAMLPLGAFALLIIGHMALDTVKYREIAGFSWVRTIAAVLRESLVDVTLLSLGLLFALYLHHSLPAIAGLSGLYRAEVTIARALGTFIPKYKILGHVAGIVQNLQGYLSSTSARRRRLEPLEQICLFSLTVIVALLLLAPSVLSLSVAEVLRMIKPELMPWHL